MYGNDIYVVESKNEQEENDYSSQTGEGRDFTNNGIWQQVITPRNGAVGNYTTKTTIISNRNEEGVSLLLTCSRFQRDVVEITKELHDLTGKIESIHKDPPVLEDINDILPPLMASLMERREKAKRLYRTTLNNHIESYELDIEQMLSDLERELSKIDDLLALHPRRGTFY